MADFEQLQTELSALSEVVGITPIDIIALPRPLGTVVRSLVRDKTISVGEFANKLAITPKQASTLATILVEKGYLLVVEEDDSEELTYRIRYARIPRHNIPLDL